jgi:hypothetical protein
LKVVVVKNTMSPATAGNAVTFPSFAVELFTAVSEYGKALDTRSAYCREKPINWYAWLTPFDGSRSLPVPKKMYCCVPPTVTLAIDENSGCVAPTFLALPCPPVKLAL